jgi:hypothetical protein
LIRAKRENFVNPKIDVIEDIEERMSIPLSNSNISGSYVDASFLISNFENGIL